MTSALIVGTKNMNIVPMVLDVTTIYALVRDLGQHSCNMAQVHRIKYSNVSSCYYRIARFLKLYLNTLKNPEVIQELMEDEFQ